MRNILFRGKRVDNGEWIEGYYVYISAGEFTYDREHHFIQTEYKGRMGPVYDVEPKTVGQYTEFYDVNGKNIFEGDIVERVRKVEGQPRRMYVVDHRGSWMLWNGPDDDDFLWNWCAPATDHGVQVGGCIIVGNIHDNPEWLEENQ